MSQCSPGTSVSPSADSCWSLQKLYKHIEANFSSGDKEDEE